MTDRRQVLQAGLLAAAGLVVLPSCSGSSPTEQPSPTPDAQQADELELIKAYNAAIAAGTASTQVLTRIRDEHAAHLRALGWQQAAPGPDASSSAEGPGRAALIRAERRSARSRSDAARESTDIEQAQILALIAASESQHIVTLERL